MPAQQHSTIAMLGAPATSFFCLRRGTACRAPTELNALQPHDRPPLLHHIARRLAPPRRALRKFALARARHDDTAPSRELADESRAAPNATANTSAHDAQRSDATRILVLVEADEGVHLALEDDSAFEALPHPLASKPISAAAQAALATHGVAPGATTFDATELVSRAHPLLRHRVF